MKVLVLSCNTGGGHNSCANYIKEELNINNIDCDVKDYLSIVGKKTSKRIEKIYLGSTKGKGNAFKLIYKIGELYNKTNIQSPVYVLNKIKRKKLYNFIVSNKYDIVICTHLFPSMGITSLKKDYNIPLINIATDYECIPFWNETKADIFVIPSKLLMKRFIDKGINKKCLMPSGIPVATSFSNVAKTNYLKKDKEIITLISGSMGFGNIAKLVKMILEYFPNCYLLVICGNNKKLEKKLNDIDNDNLIVKGFIKNINEYMKESSVVVTKPGGLSTTEVATIHKPLVLMMPIPGVENYNADFFSENKMALKATSEGEVIDALDKLLKDKALQKQMMNNQKRIINENSAKDLVSYIKKEY